MARQPHYKTKIIGGKLITVLDDDPVHYSNAYAYSRVQPGQQLLKTRYVTKL